MEVEPAVPKGENYTSLVLRVKIKTVTASGAKKTFSVIVKLSKTSEEAQEILKELSAFRIETKVRRLTVSEQFHRELEI